MSTSFQNKKQLRYVITLGTGTFGSSKNNQIILEGFRSSTTIDKAGGMQMSTLRAQIYGVAQKDMNSVTTLQWKPKSLIANTIEVYAIDGDAITLVFAGNIVNAWGDYNAAPDVFLHVQAQAGFYNQLRAVPPLSFKGQSDVAVVMKQLAEKMGYVFENNGVNVQLTDLYLPNTGLEQARELANIAKIDMYVDDKILAITPRYSPRAGKAPLISKDSGMIGYPTFDGIGVNFTVLYNPTILFGGLILVESTILQANGQWVVTSLNHKLESEKPGGSWFTSIRGTINGLAVLRQ